MSKTAVTDDKTSVTDVKTVSDTITLKNNTIPPENNSITPQSNVIMCAKDAIIGVIDDHNRWQNIRNCSNNPVKKCQKAENDALMAIVEC